MCSEDAVESCGLVVGLYVEWAETCGVLEEFLNTFASLVQIYRSEFRKVVKLQTSVFKPGYPPTQNATLNVSKLTGLNLRPEVSVWLLLLLILIQLSPSSNLSTETSSTD